MAHSAPGLPRMTHRARYALLGALVLLSPPAPGWGACQLGVLAELPVTMNNLRPLVNAKINGTEAQFIADSGAFSSTLTPAAARRFKLPLQPAPPGLDMNGIGGQSRTWLTTVKTFTLVDVPFTNVDFVVGGNDLPGAVGLLGQNVFRIADVEYDLANGVIRLIKPHDCRNAELAYWVKDPTQPYSVADIDWATAEQPHTTGLAYVNDARVRVVYDTGSPTSVLTLAAAARAGVKPADEGVMPAGQGSGVGHSLVESWIAPFASFKIGQEEIRNTRLRIGSLGAIDTDMLLGSDFFLSHRIYVANSQHKLYFTYNGGPVFNLEGTPQGHGSAAAGAAPPLNSGEQPADAEGFARRGAAFASRRDFEHAIADLSRASELAPNESQYFYARGMARWGNRQPDLALADFDQALKLKPDAVPVLVARARLRLQGPGRDAALADLDAADRAAAPGEDLRLHMGQLYQREDRLPQAIAQYDKWIAAHGEDVHLIDARNERCWARALLGEELDKALADCNAAVKARPDDAVFLDSRALVRLRSGDYDRAIADYDAALKLQPRNAWSLFCRGLARQRKGDGPGADADLAEAATIDAHIAATAAKYHLSR